MSGFFEKYIKFEFKCLNKLSKKKHLSKLPFVRFFNHFWLHIIYKEINELDARYDYQKMAPREMYVDLKRKFKKKNVIPFMDLCVATTCSLNCQDCTEWIPYLKNKEMFSAKKMIAQLDALFQYVDYVHFVSPLGGEAFLNPELDKILEYLAQKTDEGKIGFVRLVTNGTICPSEKVLRFFKHPKFSIAISNYGNVLNAAQKKQLAQLKKYLQDNHCKYFMPENFKWINLGTPHRAERGKKELKKIYSTCFVSNCVGFFEGKLFHCGRSYILDKNNWEKAANKREMITLFGAGCISSRRQMKRAIYRFYCTDYLNACNWCCGIEARKEIEPAIQMKG